MRKVYHASIILSGVLLVGCSQKDKKPAEQTTVPTEVSVAPVAPMEQVPLVQKEEVQQTVTTSPIVNEPISDVEDAYEEGVAQAEEDRLAGHPGMNYSDDYDDDDENEAYEEGYEDE